MDMYDAYFSPDLAAKAKGEERVYSVKSDPVINRIPYRVAHRLAVKEVCHNSIMEDALIKAGKI